MRFWIPTQRLLAFTLRFWISTLLLDHGLILDSYAAILGSYAAILDSDAAILNSYAAILDFDASNLVSYACNAGLRHVRVYTILVIALLAQWIILALACARPRFDSRLCINKAIP